MKKTIILSLYLVVLSFATWSQTDSIPITGTAIDTTKVYDGTTAANIITIGEFPLLPYNQVTINAEAHYLDASVGENKPVVVTFSLTGADAYHYQTPASITLYADITPLNITAEGLLLQHTREYNGTTDCDVLSVGNLQGVLPGDTVEQTVTASFITPSAGLFKPIDVTHTLNGPQAMNYTVTDNNFYIGNILRRTVTPSHVYVYFSKEYDGTDTARIDFQPNLGNTIEDDDINVHLTANFDTPEIGDNKTIYLNYQLLGADTANYTLQADSIYSNDGRIIPVLIFDTMEDGQPFVPTAYGYCDREFVSFRYHILQGELAYYCVSFPDESLAAGFSNVPITYTSDTAGTVQFIVTNAPAGSYNATIEFYSAGHVLRQYPVSFNINLPKNYLTMPFDDVISIDNSGNIDGQPNRFRTFQWYHNDEAIPNANKPYYQELGGLSGKYSVMVNMGADDEAMVCPTDIATTDKVTVSLMPSPVVSTTTVRLQGFDESLHQLQVYNSYGILVHSATFEGAEHQLNLTALPQGTYLVTVDGHSIKTLKL